MSEINGIQSIQSILYQTKTAANVDITKESEIVKAAKGGAYNNIEKAARAKGINLTDTPSQKFNMRSWMQNPYSGYPTLLANIARLLGDKKLSGSRPALITINGTLTNGGSKPIKKGATIDPYELKYAIIVRWAEKGNDTDGLDKVNSSADKAAIDAVWAKIVK
ncbi:MAG: hypothetical protein FD145_276 [Candidatus Saganbacteria bacterium]|uniref:Uncharacterized protein n=1 Tax=Candidatus Saganbacteria bacterium TaxID=2575572 RepID=A0A833NSN8_UNCSA|nr:MAG: hypothetical protein FD145_276 [Candidatus Saganbacteria bacterium]